ncbi:MAG: PAS domain-containing protein [Pseudomonadota bacterium]
MNAPANLTANDLAEQLRVFRQAATSLASTLDLQQTLANTIAVFLPALGDFGFFDALAGDGVVRTARAHQNPQVEAMLAATSWQRQTGGELNLCALSSGKPAMYNDIDDAWYQSIAQGEAHLGLLRALNFSAMLTVPVSSGGELIGALTLFMGASGRRYSITDLDFAGELAALAAPVVSNVRLLEQQRQTTEALRLSDQRLHLALEAGKIGIWDWDVAANRISWSDEVYELHGIERGSFGGQIADFAALVHVDDRERVSAAIDESLREGDLFTCEFRAVRGDGSVAWFSTSGRSNRNGEGVVTRMVGATIDISGHKNTQVRLEALNCLLEQRVETSNTERDRIWRMSRDVLAVASQSGFLLSVNPAFKTVFGWEADEALQRPFLELVHPAHRQGVTAQLAMLGAGHPVEDVEVQMLHSDGSYRWLSWTLVPEGSLIYGVGRNVTETKKQRDEVMLASEMRLQLALDVGGMGAWELDVRTDTSTWWPGMAELHGLPPGWTLASNAHYDELIYPEDRAMVAQVVAAAMRERRGHTVEYRVMWPDGSIRWIEGWTELTLNEEGEPLQMSGVCVDVTRRKRTEDGLRFVARASAELSGLSDLAGTLERVAELAVPSFSDWCAVDMLTPEGELERVAAAHTDPRKAALALELFRRYPPARDAGKGPWQVLASGRAEHLPLIEDALLVESIADPEHLATMRGLGLRSYIGAPLAVRGKTVGVITFVSAESGRLYTGDDVALAEDIGRRAGVAIENAQLYRSLQAADRRKDEFLAMLAHELRNPLAPIRAAGDLLRLSADNPRLLKVSEVVTRQVEHMTGLVDDLLDVSRVTRGLVELERDPVDMKAVLAAAIEQVRPLIEARSHAIDVHIAAGALCVEGDEKRLVQIVANLLNNAAKYTPPGGVITLEMVAGEALVELSVCDNGIGMTPELVLGAFELFSQAARSADRSQGGLGLGLALVRSLVELHGGQVRAASKGPGCGSQFTVQLPRLAHAVAEMQQVAVSDDAHGLTKLRVLVVDDNMDAANLLGMLLEAEGQVADVCYDPLDALQKLSRQSYDACLLDIGLPGMDGRQLARHIRTHYSTHPPVLVAVSGYGQAHDKSAAFEAGFDHYLVKPIGGLHLTELLTRILDSRPRAAG